MHDALNLLRLLHTYFPPKTGQRHALLLSEDARLIARVHGRDIVLEDQHGLRSADDLLKHITRALAINGLGLPEGTRNTGAILALVRHIEREPNAHTGAILKLAVEAERAERRRHEDYEPISGEVYSGATTMPEVFGLPDGWPEGAPAAWAKDAVRLPDGSSLGGWVPARSDTRARVVAK
jgi:hypothetical protein